MSILICGAGALGSGIGGMLAAGGHDVTFLGFGEHIKAVAAKGLVLDGLWGEHHLHGIAATEDVTDIDPPEWIVLGTKSYDTRAAMESIQPYLGSARGIFVPQNGIGNEEIVAEYVAWDKILAGMVIIGFEVMEPGWVRVTVQADSVKVGRLHGPLDGMAQEFASLLDGSGVPVEAVEDIHRFKWAKLLYNSALNPLGAILRVPYGRLLASHPWSIIQDVVRETFTVLDAKEIQVKWATAEEYLECLRDVQVPATAGHRASMLQDLEAGRPTEIDFLNGVVVRMGEALEIDTPANSVLVRLIKSLEASDNP